MPLLTTKTYRIIEGAKVRLGRVARIVRKAGDMPMNGQISKIQETSLTVTGYQDDGRANTQTFTAEQLREHSWAEFITTDDLDGAQNLGDVTADKTVPIFDVSAARAGQFARCTLDGARWTNGVVRGVTEAALSISTGAGAVNISVADAQKGTFQIMFADDLAGGSGGENYGTVTIL